VVKFLIIRFSSIGDIVLTTPIVRCLKTQVDDVEIHYLTKSAFAGLLKDNPYIDKLLVLKPKLSDTIEEIKSESYDYIIDLHHNLRTAIIKNRTHILSFAFPKLNIKKWLYVHFKINKLPSVHIVDRYFETVKIFDVHNDGKGLELFLSANDENVLEDLLAYLHQGYLAVVVGAKHVTKQIPSSLLVSILEKINYPIILLGDINDKKIADEVITKLRRNDVFNACGIYSIMQSAAIVKHSKVVLTGDTGLMHIAAAFQKNIVSVWGNTVPAFGMYPYLAAEKYKIFEVNDLPCRPCSKLGFKQCPKKHFKCMLSQNVEAIVNSIVEYYEKQS